MEKSIPKDWKKMLDEAYSNAESLKSQIRRKAALLNEKDCNELLIHKDIKVLQDMLLGVYDQIYGIEEYLGLNEKE